MLIQCLIKREGPTIVSVEKMDYVFTSRPHLSGGDEESQICEVISSSHSAYFLRIPGDLYVEYKKREKQAPKPVHQPTSEMTQESFFELKNGLQIKSWIKRCKDTILLNNIGQTESDSKTRRQWVINALSDQISEIEK